MLLELGRASYSISNLHFADDTIFFMAASRNHSRTLLLKVFSCALKRLKIHLSKSSSVIGVGEVDSLSLLASDLGCRVGELPMTYLGLILGAKYRSKAIWDIWDPVVERFTRRLAAWKRTYLSKGVGLLSSKVHSLHFLVFICLFFLFPCLWFVC